jgi:hypothetical protein
LTTKNSRRLEEELKTASPLTLIISKNEEENEISSPNK